MSGFFHTYPHIAELDNYSPQYAWMVSCEYMDNDNCLNWDLWGPYSYDDAQSVFCKLTESDDIWGITLHPIDYIQYCEYTSPH